LLTCVVWYTTEIDCFVDASGSNGCITFSWSTTKWWNTRCSWLVPCTNSCEWQNQLHDYGYQPANGTPRHAYELVCIQKQILSTNSRRSHGISIDHDTGKHLHVRMGTIITGSSKISTWAVWTVRNKFLIILVVDNKTHILAMLTNHFLVRLLLIRYIDDVFMTSNMTLDQIHVLLDRMDANDDNIHIVRSIWQRLQFLDVLVVNDNDQLKTSVYHKSAAEPYIVPFLSEYPRHIHRNTIRGTLYRTAHLCSHVGDFDDERWHKSKWNYYWIYIQCNISPITLDDSSTIMICRCRYCNNQARSIMNNSTWNYSVNYHNVNTTRRIKVNIGLWFVFHLVWIVVWHGSSTMN
jgi:hypothetical protein